MESLHQMLKKRSMQWLVSDIYCKTPHDFFFFSYCFAYTVEKGETKYCTGVWKGNWYKMWCNKYKKFRFDRWAVKKTVQKVLYNILNWTVVIPLHLYIKPSFEDVLQMENEEVPLSDTGPFFFSFFFLSQSWAGSHSYSFQKEQNRTAFRPLSYKK